MSTRQIFEKPRHESELTCVEEDPRLDLGGFDEGIGDDDEDEDLFGGRESRAKSEPNVPTFSEAAEIPKRYDRRSEMGPSAKAVVAFDESDGTVIHR